VLSFQYTVFSQLLRSRSSGTASPGAQRADRVLAAEIGVEHDPGRDGAPVRAWSAYIACWNSG
jgi:hypothetical protein